MNQNENDEEKVEENDIMEGREDIVSFDDAPISEGALDSDSEGSGLFPEEGEAGEEEGEGEQDEDE